MFIFLKWGNQLVLQFFWYHCLERGFLHAWMLTCAAGELMAWFVKFLQKAISFCKQQYLHSDQSCQAIWFCSVKWEKTVQLLVDEGSRINILCGSKEEHINIQRDLIPVTCFSRNPASQETKSWCYIIEAVLPHVSSFILKCIFETLKALNLSPILL